MRSRQTRKRLLDAACRILSEESLSDLSIDHVAQCAGLSRRTFFLHFASKDQLLAEALDSLRPGQVEIYRQWTESLPREATPEQRIETLFRNIVTAIADPGWKGCAFLRVSAEFGEWSGHPVHAVAAASHHDMEQWFADELRQGDYSTPALTARQIAVLVNGLLIMQLIHRDPDYGQSALAMLQSILAAGRTAEPLQPSS